MKLLRNILFVPIYLVLLKSSCASGYDSNYGSGYTGSAGYGAGYGGHGSDAYGGYAGIDSRGRPYSNNYGGGVDSRGTPFSYSGGSGVPGTADYAYGPGNYGYNRNYYYSGGNNSFLQCHHLLLLLPAYLLIKYLL